MVEYYRIGHILLNLQYPDEMPIPVNMKKFLIQNIKSEEDIISYKIELSDDIVNIEADMLGKRKGKFCAVRENLRVFLTDTGECRCISFWGAKHSYGISLQETKKQWHIWVDRKVINDLVYDTVFIALLSLERHMISQKDIILHSASIAYQGRAILFSGPSGSPHSIFSSPRKDGFSPCSPKHSGDLQFPGWSSCGRPAWLLQTR